MNFIRALKRKECIISDLNYSIETQKDIAILEDMTFKHVYLTVNPDISFFSQKMITDTLTLDFLPSPATEEVATMTFENNQKTVIKNFPGRHLDVEGKRCEQLFLLSGVSSMPHSIEVLTLNFKYVNHVDLEHIGAKKLDLRDTHAKKITIRKCFNLTKLHLPETAVIVIVHNTSLSKFVSSLDLRNLILKDNKIREIDFTPSTYPTEINILRELLKRVEIQTQSRFCRIQITSTAIDLLSVKGGSQTSLEITADAKDIKVSCMSFCLNSFDVTRVYAECFDWEFESEIPLEFYHQPIPQALGFKKTRFSFGGRPFWFVNSNVPNKAWSKETRDRSIVMDFYSKQYFDIIDILPQPIAEEIKENLPEILSF